MGSDTLFKLSDYENLSDDDRMKLDVIPLNFGGHMQNLIEVKHEV